MTKEEENEQRKKFHKDLKGFDIKVNPFGELQSSFDIDRINAFLDENVEDKKLNSKDEITGADEEE